MGRVELEQLAGRLVECRLCPRLVEWREHVAVEKRAAYAGQEYWGRPVPGFGDPDARIVVIGLAPAAHGANRTGRMFTGDKSGDWLFASMFRTGLANQPTSTDRTDGLVLDGAWVTAPVKCAPPANRPAPGERDNCAGWFAAELEALADTRVYVTLGHYGHQSLWRYLESRGGVPRPRPRFAHGAETTLGDGRVVLASYHVSQHNTFTGRLTEEMLDAVFVRAAELARG